MKTQRSNGTSVETSCTKLIRMFTVCRSTTVLKLISTLVTTY